MPRRARPTLRTLREDLDDGWEDRRALRAIKAEDFTSLQPLDALAHPILRKAGESFGDDASEDQYVTTIACVTDVDLLEIKHGQWRAAIWLDATACWVVAAGLAKGNHQDRDDFYKRLERVQDSRSVRSLLPAGDDHKLLKKEDAARRLTEWQRITQRKMIEALAEIVDGGETSVDILSPDPRAAASDLFATVTINHEPFDDGEALEDVYVEVDVADRWKPTQLSWTLTMQILATIHPPEQHWDTSDTYRFANLLPRGSLAVRIAELRQMEERGAMATSAAGKSAHYVHSRSIAEAAVEGTSVRAICGVYFVPRQDHHSMPVCPSCRSMHDDIPEPDGSSE
ncbi:DUF3039 domain-containing protein [Brachybacterium sp. DNPG3]